MRSIQRFVLLLIGLLLALPAAGKQGKGPQVWDLGQLHVGKRYPTEVATFNHTCHGKHTFTIEVHDAPWFHLTGPATVRVRMGEIRHSAAEIDLTTQPPGTYEEGRIVTRCEDCPPSCFLDRSEIPLRLVAVAPDGTGEKTQEVCCNAEERLELLRELASLRPPLQELRRHYGELYAIHSHQAANDCSDLEYSQAVEEVRTSLLETAKWALVAAGGLEAATALIEAGTAVVAENAVTVGELCQETLITGRAFNTGRILGDLMEGIARSSLEQAKNLPWKVLATTATVEGGREVVDALLSEHGSGTTSGPAKHGLVVPPEIEPEELSDAVIRTIDAGARSLVHVLDDRFKPAGTDPDHRLRMHCLQSTALALAYLDYGNAVQELLSKLDEHLLSLSKELHESFERCRRDDLAKQVEELIDGLEAPR